MQVSREMSENKFALSLSLSLSVKIWRFLLSAQTSSGTRKPQGCLIKIHFCIFMRHFGFLVPEDLEFFQCKHVQKMLLYSYIFRSCEIELLKVQKYPAYFKKIQ